MDYLPEITKVATAFKLDPYLVAAQVLVESGGNPFAWNPEPRYHYLWDVRKNAPFRSLRPSESANEDPPTDFPSLRGDPDQEWWGQQASWGLMQVMGALARENGFDGPYLTQLTDPLVNLHVGCAHLTKLLEWAKGDYAQAFAAYNGGKGGNLTPPFRNQSYADKVFATKGKVL